MVSLKSRREYEIMKEAAQILKAIHEEIAVMVAPGIRTKDIDARAEDLMSRHKVLPAFKGYHGFPGCVCTSVNDEVVHGIPSDRRLQSGDLVGVDIGVILDGYYSDAARTLMVGEVSAEAKRLVRVTKESVYHAVNCVKTGMRLGDLSYAIQSYVEQNGYAVVRDFVGHGIGRHLHEDPQVPNFGVQGTGMVLKEGLAIAVEPMVNEGDWRVRILEDQWTVVTKDGRLSAHHEETLFFGNEGHPEVLTN